MSHCCCAPCSCPALPALPTFSGHWYTGSSGALGWLLTLYLCVPPLAHRAAAALPWPCSLSMGWTSWRAMLW